MSKEKIYAALLSGNEMDDDDDDVQTTEGTSGPISEFLKANFKHFNAATLLDAAKEYKRQIDRGGKMLVSLAGAMSTGELGISLAEMIRQDKIHCISCTGANLEEDVFNLVAHNSYKRTPKYKDLSPEDEMALAAKKLNRVTDTTIPSKAMKVVEEAMIKLWEKAQTFNEQYFPHEYLYRILRSGELEKHYEINPRNSWMLAAAQKNIPIFCPGWEDSSLGNIFASMVIDKKMKSTVVKGGIDYMVYLADLYPTLSTGKGIGFFQVGGGISGDAPICVVPLLKLDCGKKDTKFWTYFCQITDSTTSYGGYSGADPNEKITWFKIDDKTPTFVIESDATICCPLIFAYVMGK